MAATALLFKTEDGERPKAFKPMGKSSAYSTGVFCGPVPMARSLWFQGSSHNPVMCHVGPELDAARMIKERVLLKGRKVSAYFDLTPNAKMNIIGCTVAFSQRGPDGEPLDIEVVLPLSWVAGKDGRVIAQRLHQILSEAGIDPDDVIIAVTDGGGDNHGGDKLTGHGKNGTVAEAVANAVWLWYHTHPSSPTTSPP